MPTKFFTNKDGNSLIRKFEGVFTNVASLHYFDALVGYFRASGYFKVRPFLDNIPVIRILVGINVDTLTKKYHDKGQQFLANADDTKADFMQDMIQNIQEADYDEQTEKGILQFIEDITNRKIELRAHPNQKIHAKVYIFRPHHFNEYSHGEVITGSSNMTDAGLGTYEAANYEFNVSLRDYEDVKFATDEFNALWNESVPILTAEVEAVKKQTYLRDDFTPFELYMKMLMEYFGKRVEYNPHSLDLLLPNTYKRLQYQLEAANQGYTIMMKHNGFILADVVGLGKTIVACMVIKKFIYENGTHTKVLIVVPPALETSWLRTIDDFQIKQHFEIVTLGSLKQVLDENDYRKSNPDKFDLVVVDESHKFRNDYTSMYINLQEICKRPRSRPAENGDTKKKVILISATPLNNRPEDIENQLYLFQDKRNSTLENVRNLQDYFKPINEQYKKLAAEKTLNLSKLKNLFKKLRDDVVEPLVIRRTRTDIEKTAAYIDDLKQQNIIFPKVDDPIALFYELNDSLATLFFDTVSLITGLDEDGNESEGLGYFRYRAIEFLTKEEDRKIYGNVKSISDRLRHIMKTLLVKRLESSFFAFSQSIKRFQQAINNMVDMYNNNQIFIAPDLDINKLLEEGVSYDDIMEKVNTKGGNNKVYTTDAFDKQLIEGLIADKQKIDDLAEQWSRVATDPKLLAFSNQLANEFFKNKTHNPSGKLVIFSESKETAQQLNQHITTHFQYKVLTVNAQNRKAVETTIRENFDANLAPEKWKNDYDIIITTEVLAEGINLHRSNLIVNYDVPWNSTRLMQRIGRVNRIGSQAEHIYVYNFYPSTHGDQKINLVNNALRKLQAFHTAFGEDNRIFSLLEEKGEGGLYGNTIQQEENETLIYLNQLRDFKLKHPKRFAEIAKIPNKARCGRTLPKEQSLLLLDAEKGEITYPLSNTSIAYLKSENHPGIFCLITPNDNVIELNFLQAINIYKADETERAAPLPPQHHEQAIKGLEYFKSAKNQENIRTISRTQLNPVENKAITNLSFIVKFAATEQKKMALKRTIEIIKNGTYGSKGLPKVINDFFQNHQNLLKEPLPFIDKLFIEVLDNYDLSAKSDNTANNSQNPTVVNPKIVLTQSFQ